ncbi:hypothetical protein B0T14DRAFT_561881 [Immersiella caudata]|uniref:Uncharacterized protein n=1 Tax=Immersiella caudata TaxID=314043 RepID=A0AA40C5J1_9PEZI|nr:hypothetical protein B0T14DRAFT_561881 [Immersiella caudata]
MAFNLIAAYGVFSGLHFLALIPIVTFWVRSLKRGARIQSAPLRLAQLFVRISAPVYGLGVLLNAVLGAYYAAALSDRSISDSDVTLYLNLVAGLLITAGDIGITLGLYLAIIATLYVGLGRTTWWKLLRLDAPVGGALLLVLDIAFFGRNVALASGAQPTRLDRRGLLWLPLIIDLTLLAVTLGAFCAVIYTMSKIKKRGGMHVAAMEKIPTLLLSASVIWLIRCSYSVATTIKSMLPDWTREELNAQIILIPIFEVIIGATVLVLLTIVILKPVWADASLHPTTSHPAPVPIGQYPGPGPQYPQQPQQYGQSPAQYQQQVPQYGQPPAQYPQQAPQYGYPQQQQQPYTDYSNVQAQQPEVYPAGNQQQPHVYNK